jgi:uncharacterized protein YkwD
MNNCSVCGKYQDYPFHCSYCDGTFCSEHRLPENHNCPNKPVVAPPYFSVPKLPEPPKTSASDLPEPPKTTRPFAPVQPRDTRSRKIGRCPRCHRDNSQMLKHNAGKMIFKCWRCHLIYGQMKEPPYRYFRVHKKAVTRKRSRPLKKRRIMNGLKGATALFLVMTALFSFGYFFIYNSFTVSMTTTQQYIFTYINDERTSRGLPALGIDNSLATIAKSWSNYLTSTYGNITHGNFNERMQSIGLPNHVYSTGESIAYFGGNLFSYPTENLASEHAIEFVDLWLNSPPHREIMLTPSTGYMGVGVNHQALGFYGVVDFKFG